jgi:5'-nucleotidase
MGIRARMRRCGFAVLALALVTGWGLGPGPAAAREAPKPLRVLLTNDDGWDAPGIVAMRKTLVAAGYDVVEVAPSQNESGSGAKMDVHFGQTLDATEQSPGVWSVAGSPADAVYFGLGVVNAAHPPDLVVSGSNFGHNVGGIVNHSGTVGAAVTAAEQGVPAIAVSTEYDRARGPEATLAAFPATGAFTVRLVQALTASSHGGRLLPLHLSLNVNYPLVPEGKRIPGVSYTLIGHQLPVQPGYVPLPGGGWRIVPRLSQEPETVAHADTTALAAHRISISVLDGSWSADRPERDVVTKRLRSLAP